MIRAQNYISILFKVAFIAAIVCSMAYLLMLGWYNNILLDDYGFISDVDEGGAYGLMKGAYIRWQSRFSAFLVLGWIMEILGHASNLIGYTIMLLVLGYGVIYYALHNMTQIKERWLLLGSTILITNVSVMAYLEMSTFYWLCCALYTLSTYAAIALFTAIFFSKGKEWARWLVIVICSVYISGGAENFTPIIIAALGIILLYRLVKTRDWKTILEKQSQMILVSLFLLCVGFIAVIAGPGSKTRATEGELQGFMSELSLIPFVTKLVKASVVFHMRLLSRSLYYILLFPLGVYLGKAIPMNSIAKSDKVWKELLLSAIAALFAIELSITASVYGVGWYASLRAYSFVSFIIMAMVVYWGFIIGSRSMHNTKSVKAVMIISLLITASMCTYFYRHEQPMVADVHNQIEIRKELILAHKAANNNAPLILEEVRYPHIPNSYSIMQNGMRAILGKSLKEVAEPSEYFPYERYCLTTDPKNWRNNDMRRYFGVDFDVIGWLEE